MLKLFSRNALAVFALALPATCLAQPVINAVVNNFSGVLPGLPSYGIAPASLFVIYGSGMCASAPLVTQTSAGAGLPQTLNGMTISVTVNGVTTTPAIYYAIPTQVAAVLPSTTPAGTGTIKITYNGQSGSAPLVVTKSAFGILTANLTGGGPAKATNLEYQDITPTASAAPGQTIILWGSGLGADTANNDRTYPMKQDNLNNATVYIGGVKATVLYAGRSLFPGVDQIDVTVPALGASQAFVPARLKDHAVARAAAFDLQHALNWEEGGDSGFQGGCGNSVVVVADDVVSNFPTLAVAEGGGVCSDPVLGNTGTGIVQTGTVKTGSLSLFQVTEPSATSSADGLKPRAGFTTVYLASGVFLSETGALYSNSSSFSSIGSCIVSSSSTNTNTTTPTTTPLDAGKDIALKGGSLSAELQELITGTYYAALTSAPTAGTAYTFTGSGGKDVGAFTATITLPNPLDWTNEASISTVTRSQGQLITWTGGATGTYVIIAGSSTAAAVSESVAFLCLAAAGADQFTVPSYVLLALPPGNGSLGVYNFAGGVSFSATGIDYGRVSAGILSINSVTYQ
ncbi:MAG: hypothetical protein ABSH31_18195 [Bryobacteraceae bacterium]|jgi:uncharacterized protein (TIGR03437 family)